MSTEKEVTVKMKFDDYKMLSNYIKNELGYNKSKVKEMLEGLVSDIGIEDIVIRQIERYVGRREHQYGFRVELRERIEMIIEKEVKSIIDTTERAEIEKLVRENIEKKMQGI